MDLVEPHQNRNQIREKIFPFIIELTVPLPECTVQFSSWLTLYYLHIDKPNLTNYLSKVLLMVHLILISLYPQKSQVHQCSEV